MKANNLDLAAVERFVEQARSDPSLLRKEKRVEARWSLAEGTAAIGARVAFARGETDVSADLPPFQGGGGLAPDPVQLCLFGMAACFAGTFASVAAQQGVRLRALQVAAENRMDLSRSFGLADRPIIERVAFAVEVDADADDAKLAEIERLTRERCPGVECVTRALALETSVRRISPS